MTGCTVADCLRVHYAQGLCKAHYHQARTGELHLKDRCVECGVPLSVSREVLAAGERNEGAVMGRFWVPVVALVLGLVSMGATVDWTAERTSEPPHLAPPTAEVSGSSSDAERSVLAAAWDTAIQQELDRIAEEQRVHEEAVLEASRVRAAEQAASAGLVRQGGGTGACQGDTECFLACTRAHESDTAGGYGAVSPGGQYRGAYQFAAGTWSGAVTRAGFPEYAGVPADQAPPHVQDAAAVQLFGERGAQPWGGRCS